MSLPHAVSSVILKVSHVTPQAPIALRGKGNINVSYFWRHVIDFSNYSDFRISKSFHTRTPRDSLYEKALPLARAFKLCKLGSLLCMHQHDLILSVLGTRTRSESDHADAGAAVSLACIV